MRKSAKWYRRSNLANRIVPLVRSTLRNERRAFIRDRPPGESSPDEAFRGKNETLLIASYNIHKCVGLDRRFDPKRIADVIGEIDPDVIALQEAEQRFGDRAGLLDFDTLRQQTGLVPVQIAGKRQKLGWHGNIMLARNAIGARLYQIDLPGAEPRGAIAVDLDMPSGRLRIIAAHLGLLRRSRARQVRAILDAASPDDGRPVLLIGDLNEWRLGKRSSLRGLAPSFGPLDAEVASFPARFPVWSLDRILANPAKILSRIDVHDTPLARVASDHLPIKAVIRLP